MVREWDLRVILEVWRRRRRRIRGWNSNELELWLAVVCLENKKRHGGVLFICGFGLLPLLDGLVYFVT